MVSVGKVTNIRVQWFTPFLDASLHLYKRACTSVGRLVGNQLFFTFFFASAEFWCMCMATEKKFLDASLHLYKRVIREAERHNRNVELHLYRKVCLLVCPCYLQIKLKK